MKIFSKVTIFLFSNLLTSNCFGMEQDFQTQLNNFLIGDYQDPAQNDYQFASKDDSLSPAEAHRIRLENYKLFIHKHEAQIIKLIADGDIDLKQMIPLLRGSAIYAVHRFAQVGTPKILKAIIEKSSEMLEFKDSQGKTPLLHACEYSNVPCVQYLLEKKADPMKMFLEKTGQYAIHPIFYIINITEKKPPVNDQIKNLDMIIKTCPKFLAYKFKDQTCLECIEELMSPNHNWTSYPNDNPYEIKVKKEKIEYLTKFQKFIKSKTRLRRFAPKEE